MKSLPLNKAAVLSNNTLEDGIVADTSKVKLYERKRRKAKKAGRNKSSRSS